MVMQHYVSLTLYIPIIVLILLLIPVQAAPVFSPYQGMKPLDVTFSFPGGEACDRVEWTLGDGTSSNLVNTKNTYEEQGMYYPGCKCELPGATISYTYDYIYVVPWASSMRKSSTGGRPKDTVVTRTSEGLSADELLKQAEGLSAIGEMKYAAAAYADLMAMTTLDAESLVTYGDVLTGLGRLAEAEEVYAASLEGREDAEVLKKYADVLFSQGKTAKAISAMEETLLLTPDDAAAYASYARFLQKAGKTAEALEAYVKTISIQPSARLWTEYAEILASIGRNEEAADAYGQAVSAGMYGSDAWNKYATLLNKLGRKEEAQKAKEQAMNTYQPISVPYSSGSGIPTCGIGSLC